MYKTFTTNKIETNIIFKKEEEKAFIMIGYCTKLRNPDLNFVIVVVLPMTTRCHQRVRNSSATAAMMSKQSSAVAIFLSNENRWIRCIILACSLVLHISTKSGFVYILV